MDVQNVVRAPQSSVLT